MTERVARLGLRIETDSEADLEELAKPAVDLREQLLELDIESAEPATLGQASPCTRAGDFRSGRADHHAHPVFGAPHWAESRQ